MSVKSVQGDVAFGSLRQVESSSSLNKRKNTFAVGSIFGSEAPPKSVRNNDELSEMSGFSNKKGNDTVKQFCMNNMSTLESKLWINDNVITHLMSMNSQNVALLGVQKPQDTKNDKLFISTIMEFKKSEVISKSMKMSNFTN